jgi:hypothetical protein
MCQHVHRQEAHSACIHSLSPHSDATPALSGQISLCASSFASLYAYEVQEGFLSSRFVPCSDACNTPHFVSNVELCLHPIGFNAEQQIVNSGQLQALICFAQILNKRSYMGRHKLRSTQE